MVELLLAADGGGLVKLAEQLGTEPQLHLKVNASGIFSDDLHFKVRIS
jgi:hypothetical protein